jgi:hypothetical protein
MNPFLFALGVALILLAAVEPLWTALWVDGHAGPVTRRLGTTVRWVMMHAMPKDDHRLLSLTGPVVLVVTVTTWALLLWAGWVVLFSADPGSLLRAHARTPANLADRIYFAGYTLCTLGNGDFAPQGNLWELATALASLSGLLVLTLAVTYLLAVIEAVVAKRSFASQVWALGHSAEELVLSAWNGTGFPAVELQIVSLTEQLGHVSEQHQAYPMLHYYHDSRLPQSVATAIAILDDALTTWTRVVAEEVRPAPAVLEGARATVRDFLETLRTAYISRSTDQPPPLDLARLREAGVPLMHPDPTRADDPELSAHRRLILGFLQAEQRGWPRPAA